MDSDKALARPGYAVAFFLFCLPLLDAFMGLWPTRNPGDERWRFGAVGTLSNVLLVPLLALFLAMAIAVWADHRRARRVLGWLAGAFAIVLAGIALLFVLDYFQARTLIKPEFQGRVGLATGTALMKQVAAIVILALLSRAGLRGKHSRKKSDASQTPLISRTDAVRSE